MCFARHRLAVCFCCFLFLPGLAIPCTSFVLRDGNCLVFGTNYDNSFRDGYVYVNKANVRKKGWEVGSTGECASWTSKYGSLTFSLAGYQMAWAGMNEEGLVLSTMALGSSRLPPPDERAPLISALWMQYVLDTCATIDEVLATNESIRVTFRRDHYLVCDSEGNCATIEFLDGKTVCHKAESLPVRALANLPYADCVDQWRKGPAADLDRHHSFARFNRVAAKLAAFSEDGSLSPINYAFDALEDVANPGTRWSIVFDIENLTVAFRTDRNQQSRWIDLMELDFTNDTPVVMLDVHEDLSGSVEGEFIDYDRAASLQLMLRAVKHFRVPMSEKQAEEIYALLDSYAPVPPGE